MNNKEFIRIILRKDFEQTYYYKENYKKIFLDYTIDIDVYDEEVDISIIDTDFGNRVAKFNFVDFEIAINLINLILEEKIWTKK